MAQNGISIRLYTKCKKSSHSITEAEYLMESSAGPHPEWIFASARTPHL